MNQQMNTQLTVTGTVGGTVFSVLSIPTETLVSTIILACIGAVASFLTTLLLKKLYNYFTKKK